MSNTTSILNDLIETLKDGQEGYKLASENATSSDLKSLFGEYSLQRSKFSGELQSLARTLGERDPETSGSISASIHRGWINLTSVVTRRDDHAILAECERGEDSAVAAYRKATDTADLPANVLDTLNAQFIDIQAAHDRVRDLRDSVAAK